MKRWIVGLIVIATVFMTSCSLTEKKQSIVGLWEGKVKFPGIETRLLFNIASSPDGELTVEILQPDEHDDVIKVSSIALEDSNIRIEVAALKGVFEGCIETNKEIIVGEWQQGRWLQNLILRKIWKFTKYARPQTPRPPYPYNVKEVTIVNKKENVCLAGTLTWPNKSSSIPAIILISGGGGHDRDYSILRHRPFLVIADYLTRLGIAVLRFDERGVGSSTGDRSQATCKYYADDVLAGVRFLHTFNEFNPTRIGLIGHSEGGMIASVSAAESKDISFIVLLGSPGLAGAEYQYQFEESINRAMGLSEEMIASKRVIQEKIFNVLLHENDQWIIENKIYEIYRKFYPQIPEGKIKAGIAKFLSPGFQYNLTYDPASTLQNSCCPVLAIYGENDLHVPPEGNYNAMESILKSRADVPYKVIKLPGLNHFFQTTDNKEPFDYGKIEETISPIVLELISDWIINFKE